MTSSCAAPRSPTPADLSFATDEAAHVPMDQSPAPGAPTGESVVTGFAKAVVVQDLPPYPRILLPVGRVLTCGRPGGKTMRSPARDTRSPRRRPKSSFHDWPTNSPEPPPEAKTIVSDASTIAREI